MSCTYTPVRVNVYHRHTINMTELIDTTWCKCVVLTFTTFACLINIEIISLNYTLLYCEGTIEYNPLRIDSDIDENVQFYSKHGVVTPHFDRLEKLTLLCEGFKAIR